MKSGKKQGLPLPLISTAKGKMDNIEKEGASTSTNPEKEVQTSTNFQTSTNLYFSILQGLKQGKCLLEIAESLHISKSNLNYYASYLKKCGIIAKKGYATWEILKDLSLDDVKKEVQKRSTKKSSLGARAEKPITNLHALQINFPILSGEVKDQDWQIKEKLKNWLPKYKNLEILGGLTIKNNNNKSISAYAHSRNITNVDEADDLAVKIRAYVCEYFKAKHEVVLDFFGAQVKNINIATEDSKCDAMIRKGEKFELDLNKKAEKFFEKDNIDGKAWLDGSPFKFSAETNDKEWKREYLRMPFTIAGLAHSLPALQEYNRNIKLHMRVQEAQLETQKKMQATQEQTQAILQEIKKLLMH